MNETLYEITRDLFLLKDLDVLEPTNGEPEENRLEQLRHALDNLNMKFVDKVTNIVKFIKNLEAQRDAVACEAKRLSDRKRAMDNRIDWLKNYVKTAMQATQSEKIKYALFTIYVGQSQPSVEVLNIDEVEEQFIRIKKEVDKTKILEQVKSTGVIPAGVNIVQGTHLVIR
jgi:phage host-nuclease inhibitor protein Gam